jgi:hypothetical protein
MNRGYKMTVPPTMPGTMSSPDGVSWHSYDDISHQLEARAGINPIATSEKQPHIVRSTVGKLV